METNEIGALKVKLAAQELLVGLRAVMQAVQSKPILPVLSCALLRAGSGGIWLAGTNLEMTIEARVDAEVGSDGELCLPAALLMQIVERLPPDGAVEIEHDVERGFAAVVCGAARFKINALPSADFPQLKPAPAPVFEWSAALIGRMLTEVSFASSVSDMSPALSGCHFAWQDGAFVFQASDGFRLARLYGAMGRLAGDGAVSLIIPSTAFRTAARQFINFESSVEIALSDNHIWFSNERLSVMCQLIAAPYPDVSRVLAPTYKYNLIIARADLLAVCDQIEVLARDNNHSGRFEVLEDRMTVWGYSRERGDGESSAAVISDSPFDLKFGLNLSYVIEALRSVKDERIVLRTNDSNAPIALQADGRDDWLHFIMPMALLKRPTATTAAAAAAAAEATTTTEGGEA